LDEHPDPKVRCFVEGQAASVAEFSFQLWHIKLLFSRSAQQHDCQRVGGVWCIVLVSPIQAPAWSFGSFGYRTTRALRLGAACHSRLTRRRPVSPARQPDDPALRTLGSAVPARRDLPSHTPQRYAPKSPAHAGQGDLVRGVCPGRVMFIRVYP